MFSVHQSNLQPNYIYCICIYVYIFIYTAHLPLVAEVSGCVLLLHRWAAVKARLGVYMSVCPAYSCAGVESHSRSPGPLLHRCRLKTAGTNRSPPPPDYREKKVNVCLCYSKLNTVQSKIKNVKILVISDVQHSTWNHTSQQRSWNTVAYFHALIILCYFARNRWTKKVKH